MANPRKLAIAAGVGAVYCYMDEECDEMWKPVVTNMASTLAADMVTGRTGRNGILAKGLVGGAAHLAINKYAFGQEESMMKDFLTGAGLVFATEAIASAAGGNGMALSNLGTGNTSILYS